MSDIDLIAELYRQDTLTVEGTVVLHQSEPAERPCVCCGGEPHVYGIHLAIEPMPSSAVPLVNKNVGDVLHEWLYAHRFEFRDQRVRVTMERAPHPLAPVDTTYGDDLKHLIGTYINLVTACERYGLSVNWSDVGVVEEGRETVDWYLGKLGYDAAEIADVWSGEHQLTSS